MRALLALPAFIGLLVSCSPADVPRQEESRAQRGDTLVLRVRDLGSWGSDATLERVAAFGEAEGGDSTALGRITALTMRDGRIYATDGQLRVVRVFDLMLNQVGIVGRDGSGPAELQNPDGGLAVFSDGRIAVRDPGNARLQLFTPDGRSAGEWRVVDAGLRTRDNFGRHGDTLLSRVVVKADGPIESWQYGLARIAGDGRVLDTVYLPLPTLPRMTLVARRGSNTAELPVPFAPTSLWAWHPHGGFVIARGDQYAITWPLRRGLVRVERDVERVVIGSAEAAQERAYVTKGMQWLDPAWIWTGPEMPREKPLLSQLFVGEDGSVWVLREGEAVDDDDPDYRPNDASSVERRLRSRLIFDAFTSDGVFLGSVPVPAGLQLRPQPVFDVAGLVGVHVDVDGVPRVVRYTVN